MVHIVDLNKPSRQVRKREVRVHQKGGIVQVENRNGYLYVNNEKVELFSIPYISSIHAERQVREILKKKHVLNANLLDYIIDNPELTPTRWFRLGVNDVFFMGTIYYYQGNDAAGFEGKCEAASLRRYDGYTRSVVRYVFRMLMDDDAYVAILPDK